MDKKDRRERRSEERSVMIRRCRDGAAPETVRATSINLAQAAKSIWAYWSSNRRGSLSRRIEKELT
jgi:hypothetical protein